MTLADMETAVMLSHNLLGCEVDDGWPALYTSNCAGVYSDGDID